MLFSELVETELETEMWPIIARLLELKSSTSEIGEGKRIDKLNEYIDANLAALKREIAALPSEEKADWGRLDELFLSVVG